ncbi:Hypothetical predicted protein [Prunus dulcis]|uniref:Uncharacterized protein n=1 Tax=Prunus dulcis TaxID=3755 RepID=A0A5E4GKC8_PRUDU|nr:hypothetical protein L3X38_013115 [Prunus dulcis]VVA40254.1 Hypothetical predicted protein [Prunus dulcis]
MKKAINPAIHGALSIDLLFGLHSEVCRNVPAYFSASVTHPPTREVLKEHDQKLADRHRRRSAAKFSKAPSSSASVTHPPTRPSQSSLGPPAATGKLHALLDPCDVHCQCHGSKDARSEPPDLAVVVKQYRAEKARQMDLYMARQKQASKS